MLPSAWLRVSFPPRPVSVTADRRLASHAPAAARLSAPDHRSTQGPALVKRLACVGRGSSNHRQSSPQLHRNRFLGPCLLVGRSRGALRAGRKGRRSSFGDWSFAALLIVGSSFESSRSLASLALSDRCHPWHPRHQSGAVHGTVVGLSLFDGLPVHRVAQCPVRFRRRGGLHLPAKSVRRRLKWATSYPHCQIAFACPQHRLGSAATATCGSAVSVVCRGGVIRLGLFSGRTGALSDRLLMIPNDRQLRLSSRMAQRVVYDRSLGDRCGVEIVVG